MASTIFLLAGFVFCAHAAENTDLLQYPVSGNSTVVYGPVKYFLARHRCYDDLGCFSSGGAFFHPLYRPVDLLPQDREKINTRFQLFTKVNPKEYQFLRAGEDKTLAYFQKGKDVKFIIHGYLDNQLFGEWMRDMKDEFLLNADLNVIIVDWSGGNTLPYIQASANTRVVGAEIALLITWLQEKVGLKLENVHILGHSLGSQVAGYAGERLSKLGRITAMDPAEPYFQYMPANVRIDPTDALYVDVVHTDSNSILLGGFGMSQLAGHVDFFPNDGKKQPGCSKDRILSVITDGLAQGARDFVACNHQRSVNFVAASINHHRCLPVAYVCRDWQTFLDGECADCGQNGRNCAVLGLKGSEFRKQKGDTTAGAQKTYYLKTGSESPYCLLHFQVTLVLEKDGKNQDGIVKLKIRGSDDVETFTLGDGKVDLDRGQTYRFLVTTKKYLGPIKSVTLSWEVKKLLPSIITTPKLKVKTLTVRPMNEINTSSSSDLRYCLSGRAIETKKSITLTSGDVC